ncbi:MAG: TetR family transcriptional regulator, partial [Caulobacteraceae bacterium]|nr:TetR family transcriptional regulator [Caulobacteraceae bacterium]
MTPADGSPPEDEVAGLLLEASFDLLAHGGWGNFSLRAVADSIGVAGSAASHRFGDRAGLVAAVCDAAIESERSQMDRFLPGIRVDSGGELAAVLCEWLEQRVRCNRRQARACSELLLVSYRDPAFHTFSGRWVETCRRMVARLAPSFNDEASRAVAAFLAVEIPYWLLLADDPLFRLASGEALRRIVMLAQRSADPLPVFWLQRGLELPDARR